MGNFEDIANNAAAFLSEWVGAGQLITPGEALLAALLLFILLTMYVRRRLLNQILQTVGQKSKEILRHIDEQEVRTGSLLKEEAVASSRVASRLTEEVKKLLAAAEDSGAPAGQDANKILAPLTRQAEEHLKRAEEQRRELGERIIESSGERMNRIETRIEGLSELVKERLRADGGGEDGGELRDKLEQQSVYLHDEFAALGQKIDGVAKTGDGDSGGELRGKLEQQSAYLRDEFAALGQRIDAAAKTGGAAAGGDSGSAAADNPLLESLSKSVNRLGEEMNAKLFLLYQKLEKNEELWRELPDALPALRKRLEELSQTGAETRGEISFAQLMQTGEDNETDGRRRLSTMLPQILPLAYFTLNAELPGGLRADALVRFPDPGDSVVIDAGFAPPRTADGEITGDDLEFSRALVAHIDHIADNLVAPPRTGENALLFISSESLFAEIHSRLRDALRHAQARKVWPVSPAVLPAVLNTVNSAVRDHDARRQLRELRATAARLAEESRHFENRIAEIGDHISSAWRSVQRAENAGGRLAGDIREMSSGPPRGAEPPRIPENNDSS